MVRGCHPCALCQVVHNCWLPGRVREQLHEQTLRHTDILYPREKAEFLFICHYVIQTHLRYLALRACAVNFPTRFKSTALRYQESEWLRPGNDDREPLESDRRLQKRAESLTDVSTAKSLRYVPGKQGFIAVRSYFVRGASGSPEPKLSLLGWGFEWCVRHEWTASEMLRV